MSGLRIFGMIIGAATLVFAFFRYRGPKWKRSNFIWLSLFGLLLMLISYNPNLVNFAKDMLSLEEYLYGRFLALLILSNVFLFFFIIHLQSRQSKTMIQLDNLIRSIVASETHKTIDCIQKIKPIMILIPAYNEAENLKELLPKMPTQIQGHDIGVLVIDDGSGDDTRAEVLKHGHLVASNPVNRGGGAALRLGYDILKKSGCEICVTMDADGQHQPHEIINLVQPILNNRYDFVIGSRIIGRREKDSLLRLAGVHVFGRVISLLLGKKITDPSSNFRAFKMASLASIRLYEDQYHTSELIIEAVKKNISIGEVPITIFKRRHGKSKKGKDLIYAVNFAKTIIKTWWR